MTRLKDHSPLSEDPSLNPIFLMSDGVSARIEPIGNRISKLTLGDISLLIDPRRADGSIGSSHLCIPRLGPDNQFGLKQHGESRSAVWEVVESGVDQAKLRRIIAEGSYPAGLMVEVSHILKNGIYRIETTLTNQGSAVLPTLVGWHFYWNGLVGYKSYQGLILNGIDISGQIVPASSEVDLQDDNVIKYSGGSAIRLVQSGYPNAVLWAGGVDEQQMDRHYFCLEPVQGRQDEFGTRPETQLQPGEKRVLKISLSVIK